MAKISRYEDLVAYQTSDELANLIDEQVLGPASRNQKFCDQILKSSAKAPAQIAEGFLRFRSKESAYYYRIARASLGETQAHLRRGLHRRYWSQDTHKRMWDLSEIALKTTTGLLSAKLQQIREEEARPRKRPGRQQNDNSGC
jgi:four helix bundle protein